MGKVVLTSCEIIDSKLKEQFYNLLDKDINTIKLLFITIAVDGEKRLRDAMATIRFDKHKNKELS